MVVTPHVAQKSRHSAIDGRTTRHPGYAKSQRCRKKIEEPFGWAKTVGGMAQTMYRGIERVRALFTLAMAACNLARLPKLIAGSCPTAFRPRPCASAGPRDVLACEAAFTAARAGSVVTVRAMAQMKPAISRAMAVVATTFGLPAAIRWR